MSVEVRVEPGASPATYEPKPQQLRKLSKADAYVSIDVPFEELVKQELLSINNQNINVRNSIAL